MTHPSSDKFHTPAHQTNASSANTSTSKAVKPSRSSAAKLYVSPSTLYILRAAVITDGIPKVGLSVEYKSLIVGWGSSPPLGE